MGDLLALSVFYEVAALLVLATAFGIASLALRQPPIVAFIFVGIFAGPAVLSVARSTQHIELLADLGVALLLFLVGLKLDLKLIRALGQVALATGLGQIVFTSVIGLAICLALGVDTVPAIYIAVALTFSSTIIIVKLLTDKREIDSLHGRIALGFLIVQDLVVVIALAVLSAVGIADAKGDMATSTMQTSILGGVLFVGLAVAIWYVADPLLSRLARAPELLITFAIGWAVLMAALGDLVGFGKEMGGLVAGAALSNSPLREVLASRLASLREFLLLFFFIALGSQIEFDMIPGAVTNGMVLSLFVLIGNPLIVMVIMGSMGYRKRTGFLAGLTVAQISEFSLVLMAMGLSLGHVRPDDVGLVTVVGLVTITASTYMIYYSHPLYARLEAFLGVFERASTWREPVADQGAKTIAVDVLVFGLGRYGSALVRRLRERGMKVVAVDFDPQTVKRARGEGIDAIFGDVTDPDIASWVPIESAAWAVCTTPAPQRGLKIDDPRRVFLQTMRAAGFQGRTVVSAADERDVADMQKAGASLVLQPFDDAADEAVDLILARAAPADTASHDRTPTQPGKEPLP